LENLPPDNEIHDLGSGHIRAHEYDPIEDLAPGVRL
jgi:hypothetical protein